MSEILDISKVCRCCHSQGIFKLLNESFSYNGQLEIYSDMIRQAFNIEIKPSPNLSYSICEVCIPRLCDAFVFSRQVISCEQLIYQYYSTQYKDKDIDYKDEIKVEFNEEEFKTEVECQDSNSCDQNDNGSFSEWDVDDQPLSTLKDNCEQIALSEVNIGRKNRQKLLQNVLENSEHEENNRTQKILEVLVHQMKIYQNRARKPTPNACGNTGREKNCSEYESCSPGPSTKKKLRTEIVDKKRVTTYSRQDFKCSEDQSTDNESQRLNKAAKTSAERGRAFRVRKALHKQQSKQEQDATILEIPTENIRSTESSVDNRVPLGPSEIRKIEKRAKMAAARRRWREKKRALMGHQKKQAKTAAQRMKEYRARKKLAKKILLEEQSDHDLNAVSTSSSGRPCQYPGSIMPGGRSHHITIKKDTKSKKAKVKIKKYSCEVCAKKFSYNGSLEMHMRIHTGEKTYVCRICDTKYSLNRELIKHISTKHSKNGSFPCTLCTKHFEKPTVLKNHLTTHFSGDKFKCVHCNKEFQRKKGLKEHLKTHTGERNFTCTICNKSFGHNQTLKSHILTHTGERPFVCDVCGRRFPQRTHLKRHIYIIHSGVKPYACKVCSKQFSSKSYLSIHERQHTGERPYTCDVCKKDFTAYTTLKVHMRVHTGLKPYVCTFCNRQFAQMASFKLHERTHTGERPFSCKVCKKAFSDNGYLKIHMRVHTGEKPFSCDICKRSFRETGQLKRHVRVHTGVKPYTCKICNKQIGNLSKHMRVHSDERPFNCNVCSKQFTISGNLKLHMRVHTGEKPFSCDICDSHFTQSSGLKRHKCSHGKQ